MTKRVFSIAIALIIMLSCFAGISVSAEGNVPEEFGLFIAYGGDKAASNDWGYQYWGGDVPEGVTATNGTIKVGETVSVSLTFDQPTVYTWVVTPCLTADDLSGVTALDFDVVCKINGEEVAIDYAADSEGRLWWNENTGDYAATQCIRLAGTYNEWGQKFITVPEGVTSIEYVITLNSVNAPADEPVVEGPAFDLFVAYGGDKVESNDWGYEYYGADTEKSAGITATNAQIHVGETATIALTFDNAAVYSWFFAPCLVAEDVTWIGDIDFTITCKVNGQEVDIDMNADSQGRTWWTEGTGEYPANECIRLAGGYNEWGAQFIAQPEGLTTIEYTITINSITEASAHPNATESTEEYLLFIAYGGDKEAENDWGYQYYGADAEGITAVTATVKSGDTATISLTFDSANFNSWFFAPCLVGTGAGTYICEIDMDIVCKIDGVEVPIDMDVNGGINFWAEGTGSYVVEDCVRLAGGYNEWAPNVQYIAKPGSFTTIEYTITFNSIMIDEPEEAPVVEIDKNGTYNAYLMLQTPNWTFRNAHDDTFYGINGTSWEALGLTWGQYLVHQDHPGETWGTVTDAVIAGNGTYSLKITDFGTIFADDFAAAGQDYFNIIAISTDLPAGAPVVITNVELVVDGQVRHTYAEAVINEESTGCLQILIQNIWNNDVKEISYYPAPTESLEVRFTISGFDYDQAPSGDNNGENENNNNNNNNNEQNPGEQTGTTTEPTTPEKGYTVVYIVIGALVVLAVIVAVIIVSKKKKKA